MLKNGICLGGASKQNAFFPEKCAPKNAPMPSLSRIGPAIIVEYKLIWKFWKIWRALFSCYLHLEIHPFALLLIICHYTKVRLNLSIMLFIWTK